MPWDLDRMTRAEIRVFMRWLDEIAKDRKKAAAKAKQRGR